MSSKIFTVDNSPNYNESPQPGSVTGISFIHIRTIHAMDKDTLQLCTILTLSAQLP